MKLAADAIEKYATNAVENVLNLSPYLSTFIADNDKEPSWDGNVYIFKTDKKRKDKMHGRIPIQVRGKQCDEFPKKEKTYQIEVAHLENYLKDGGAILFVVYIKCQPCLPIHVESKVFYSTLTPIKLMKILASRKKEDQKTIMVTVNPLPDSPDEIATICLNCMEDCHKQASFVGGKLPTIEELENDNSVECIMTSISGFGIDKDYFKALLNHETYFYAKLKGLDIPIPLSVIPIEKVISEDIDKPISVDGKKFFDSYKRVRRVDSTTITIGNCLSIAHIFADQKIHCSFRSPAMLRNRTKALQFFVALIKAGHFEIDKDSFPYPIKPEERDDVIKAFSCELTLCQRAVETLDKLHCTDDVDITKLSNEELRNLHRLSDAVMDNKPIRGLKDNQSLIVNINIGRLRFLVCLEKIDGENGSYMVSDFFETELIAKVQPNEEAEHLCVPKYIALRKEEFLHLSNIRYNQILPTFKKFERSPFLLQMANMLMLEVISAFDEAEGMRKDALYNLADEFASWLQSMPDEGDMRISLLNKLQITKRMRDLTDEEDQLLMQIVDSYPDQNDILVGAYLLLDNQKLAKWYFNKLDEKEQEEFRQHPINKFWK